MSYARFGMVFSTMNMNIFSIFGLIKYLRVRVLSDHFFFRMLFDVCLLHDIDIFQTSRPGNGKRGVLRPTLTVQWMQSKEHLDVLRMAAEHCQVHAFVKCNQSTFRKTNASCSFLAQVVLIYGFDSQGSNLTPSGGFFMAGISAGSFRCGCFVLHSGAPTQPFPQRRRW